MVWLLLTYPAILLLSPQVFLSFLSYPLYSHFHLLFSLSKRIFHHFVLLPAPFIFSSNKELSGSTSMIVFCHLPFSSITCCYFFYFLSSCTNNLNNMLIWKIFMARKSMVPFISYLQCTRLHIFLSLIHIEADIMKEFYGRQVRYKYPQLVFLFSRSESLFLAFSLFRKGY